MKKEEFLEKLFAQLWNRYRERISYVRRYEEILRAHGERFLNDHIAFRTIALQKPMAGIFQISRIFEALGYIPVTCYDFPDKHLSSIHYQHTQSQFPKLFITQLKSWELSIESQRILFQVFKSHCPPLSQTILNQLQNLEQESMKECEKLLNGILKRFEELPWDIPQKSQVLKLDRESQYGAWVLIHGYDVNHFTASVNTAGVESLNDIEKVASEMVHAGIPMKKEIEGERGSKLRQTSTESIIVPVTVHEGSKRVEIPWTYAYFEIAERPLLKNPVSGKLERFEGFLGTQATHLFQMTDRSAVA